MSAATISSMEGISKALPGVRAADDVGLSQGRGEVLALLGDNGDGKVLS